MYNILYMLVNLILKNKTGLLASLFKFKCTLFNHNYIGYNKKIKTFRFTTFTTITLNFSLVSLVVILKQNILYTYSRHIYIK